MKLIFKPISLNAKDYNVILLHKAVAALGMTVSKSEVSVGKAGKDTLAKVRRLQGQLNIRIDDSILLDETTAVAGHSTPIKTRLIASAAKHERFSFRG